MDSPIKRRVSNARLQSPLPDMAPGGVAISRLERKADELSAGGSDPFGFQNMRDNVYTGQIIVAGQNFTVSILPPVICMGVEGLWWD